MNKFLDIKFPLDIYFPPNLIPDTTGLVAIGGELSELILIEAYSKGIFPWTGAYPIPWYSPDPRLILIPQELHISKTLEKFISKNDIEVKYDNNFLEIINKCATVNRKDQDGTWITDNMIDTYSKLFNFNIVHTVEIYIDNKLCGGLYGISLGKTFFGESMFHTRTNCSKVALFYLTEKLKSLGISMIDCQQSTPHMKSMGAKEVTRDYFIKKLEDSLKNGIYINKW